MTNQRNIKFNFGLLNNAQDPSDIGDKEAQSLRGVDTDKIALGTLESSSLLDNPAPTGGTVRNTATLSGRNFRIDGLGYILFEETPGGTEQRVNVGEDAIAGFPRKGQEPTVSLSPKAFSLVIGANDITGISIYQTPTTVGSLDGDYIIRVSDATVSSEKVDIFYQGSFVETRSFTYNVPQNLTSGGSPVNLTFVIPSSYTAVLNDETNFNLSSSTPLLPPDGDYVYRVVNVQNNSGPTNIVPQQDIEGLPSDTVTLELKNFDELGNKIASNIPQVTFTSTSPVFYTDETWCYRKGPNEDVFVRIAVIKWNENAPNGNIYLDNDPSTSIPGLTFEDDGFTSNLVEFRELQSGKDEAFQTIAEAIGNGLDGYSMLFEKDNRLWAQPANRKDLLLYSRVGDWWGWNRNQSFSFDSDIQDLAFVRDTRVVGGEFTLVVFTENGIYHVTGSGVESSPYSRILAVPEINVQASSVVNMADVLVFMTKSPNQGYDEGRFGQKVYQYNLTEVTEISGRVRNSNVLTSANNIQYAQMKGSDKYVVKKEGSDNVLIYNRFSKGWTESDLPLELSGLFTWKSKDFTPEVMERFKLAYARKMKFAYTGAFNIVFNIYGETDSATQQLTLSLPSVGERTEYLQRMPSIKGRRWNFSIEATSANSVMYDMWFVR